PAPAPAPRAEAPKPRGPAYIVRAGTFKGKENAEKLRARLARRGLPVSEVKPVVNPKLGEMWVVELAPAPTRAAAEGLAAKVRSYEKVKPRIIEMER
ncbi:MAG: SPOR domain-containing protein, partial [Candidatus Bathyarchaeota archaeon]|nr:SPOR domain-containing protein [Candidatus Bathyarchaeota archaeon]